MDKQSDIFNNYVGGLAVLSAIISVVLYLRTHLPAARLKVLDELSRETREIYEKSCADGLLLVEFQIEVEQGLLQVEAGREELREQTYKAITIIDQCIALVGGLSTRIGRLSDIVKRLRSLIVTTTEQNRRSRSGGSAVATPGIAPPNDSSAFDVSDSCDITDYNPTYPFIIMREGDIIQSDPNSRRPSPLVTPNEQPPSGHPDPDSESITSTLVGRRRTFSSLWSWIQDRRRTRQDAKNYSSQTPDNPFDSGSLPV